MSEPKQLSNACECTGSTVLSATMLNARKVHQPSKTLLPPKLHVTSFQSGLWLYPAHLQTPSKIVQGFWALLVQQPRFKDY